MKRWGLLMGLALLPVTAVAAPKSMKYKSGDFGMGVILGSPTGISAKYWLEKDAAWDAALGFGDLSFHADYLRHVWDLFPPPEEGKLPAYWGVGVRVKDKKKDTELAARLVGGVEYLFPRHPLEVFLEIVPALKLTPDVTMGLDAGVGVRYYFTKRK